MASSSSTQNNTNTAYFDHFTCNICLEVLRDPVQCVKNEHYFCKKCITKHLTRSQTCPVCQDALTPESLRPISRTVANILQQFQLALRCMYASRGCTTAVRHEALLSHHEECGFVPVQCSHDGCEEIVNRQDLESHQQQCQFRSITCEDCHEAMRQREYGKHTCVLRREVDENKRDLAEVKKILREIQDEQLRQGVEIQRLASRESRQPHATQGQQCNNTVQQAREVRQLNPTQGQRRNRSEADSASTNLFSQVSSMSSPIQNQATVNSQIVVAGGGGYDLSYEVFDWSTRKWTLYEDTLFFSHEDGFSFVYENEVMICRGTNTNRLECVDIASASSSAFPSVLPKDCGRGVLCGDKVLTFGQSVSATSLKPPFNTAVLVPYDDGRKLSSYGAARVNENAVVILGGYYHYSKTPNRPYSYFEAKEDVLLYNPTTKVMKKLAPLPYELVDMAVVLHDDNLIILGGRKNYEQFCSDVLIYNVTNQTCRKLPSMLEIRSNCAAVIIGDKIIAIGGYAEEDCRSTLSLSTAEYLVLGEGKWKKLPEMHRKREGATACLLQ